MRRMKTPPKTSVISRPQPAVLRRCSGGCPGAAVGARMNSPEAAVVPPGRGHDGQPRGASSALAIRLRSSVRWATSVMVACGSRRAGGARAAAHRRPHSPSSCPERGSEGAVARAGLIGAGPRLGRARLGEARLLVQLTSRSLPAEVLGAGVTGAEISPRTGVAWAASLVTSSRASPSFMPFISPLKIRSERPSEREAARASSSRRATGWPG